MEVRYFVGVVTPRDSLELYNDQCLGNLNCKEHMNQPIGVDKVRLSCYNLLDEWFNMGGTKTPKLNTITMKLQKLSINSNT